MPANPPILTTQHMLDELSKYVIAEPYPFVLDLEKCHGSRLVTVDGREIFDRAGYFGAKLIAHNHPGLGEPDYIRKASHRGQQQNRQP
jgi:L-lysine 6-transaminase